MMRTLKTELAIRSEVAADIVAIRQLTTAAFEGAAVSSGSEARIVDQLRADGALTISLVATHDDKIVGHLAVSPVEIDIAEGDWFGVGPVSVSPDHQQSGIGSRLIKQTFERLEAMGAGGCVVVGDPAYYTRFGFISDESVGYNGIDSKYVMWRSFGRDHPVGEVGYHSAFDIESS